MALLSYNAHNKMTTCHSPLKALYSLVMMTATLTRFKNYSRLGQAAYSQRWQPTNNENGI